MLTVHYRTKIRVLLPVESHRRAGKSAVIYMICVLTALTQRVTIPSRIVFRELNQNSPIALTRILRTEEDR